MLDDRAMQRIYEAMGIAGEDPSARGRQRRVYAAIEAAHPDIRASIEAELISSGRALEEAIGEDDR